MNMLDEVVYYSQIDEGDNLTRRDVLECLIEECSEVIQAATKILRFGWDRNWPGYGINNEVLMRELGDLDALVISLRPNEPARKAFFNAQNAKIQKVAKWKKYMREHPEHGPQNPM